MFLLWDRNMKVFRMVMAGTVVAYSIALAFLIVFTKDSGSECE